MGDLFRSRWLQVACGAKVRRWKRAPRSCELRPNALPCLCPAEPRGAGCGAGFEAGARLWGAGLGAAAWGNASRAPGLRAEAPSPRCTEPRRERGAGAGATRPRAPAARGSEAGENKGASGSGEGGPGQRGALGERQRGQRPA